MRLIFNTQLSITISDTGKIIEVNILVEVLGYSRYKIYKVSFLKTRTVLMSLLIEIFGNIKGVPKITITDNMKPIVNKPRTRYFKGEVNSQFEEFSKDWLYTKSGAWKNSSPGFQFLYTKRQISNIIKVYKNN